MSRWFIVSFAVSFLLSSQGALESEHSNPRKTARSDDAPYPTPEPEANPPVGLVYEFEALDTNHNGIIDKDEAPTQDKSQTIKIDLTSTPPGVEIQFPEHGCTYDAEPWPLL